MKISICVAVLACLYFCFEYSAVSGCDNCQWRDKVARLEHRIRLAESSDTSELELAALTAELNHARSRYVVELEMVIGDDGVEREYALFADGSSLHAGGPPPDLEEVALRETPFVNYSPPGIKQGDAEWGTWDANGKWLWYYRRLAAGEVLSPNRLEQGSLPTWFLTERKNAQRKLSMTGRKRSGADASKGSNGGIQLLEKPQITLLHTPEFQIKDAQLTHDGRRLVVAGAPSQNLRYGKVLIWDTSTGEVEFEIRNPERSFGRVGPPVLSPDGNYLLLNTGYKHDYEQRLWDLRQQQLVSSLSPSSRGYAFSPDNRYVRAGKQVLRPGGDVVAESSGWSNARWTADNRLIWGNLRVEGQEIQIDDPTKKTPSRTIVDPERRFSSWALLGDRHTVLAIMPRDGDSYLRYYDVASGNLLKEIPAPPIGQSDHWRISYDDEHEFHPLRQFQTSGNALIRPFSSGRDLFIRQKYGLQGILTWKDGLRTSNLFEELVRRGEIRLQRPHRDLNDSFVAGGREHLLLCYKDWPEFEYWRPRIYAALVTRRDYRVVSRVDVFACLDAVGGQFAEEFKPRQIMNFVPETIQLSDNGEVAYFVVRTSSNDNNPACLLIRFGESHSESKTGSS